MDASWIFGVPLPQKLYCLLYSAYFGQIRILEFKRYKSLPKSFPGFLMSFNAICASTTEQEKSPAALSPSRGHEKAWTAKEHGRQFALVRWSSGGLSPSVLFLASVPGFFSSWFLSVLAFWSSASVLAFWFLLRPCGLLPSLLFFPDRTVGRLDGYGDGKRNFFL